MITAKDIIIPLDVSRDNQNKYIDNYLLATKSTGRLMLFAGDQKVEHLNDDFVSNNITLEDNDPEHMFKIASLANIGIFATQLGLICRYGMDYKNISYIVKMNSKTNLVAETQKDPYSKQWLDVSAVIKLKNNSGLKICGVGYTVYIGSEFEPEMLHEAAKIINEAHEAGLIAILWMYPKGIAVKDTKDPHLIAGAAGVAACLGADFVKVNYPKKEGINSAEALKEAVIAAGRTKLVCAGGSNVDPKQFLQILFDQIHISGASGNATGRNIHQKPLEEAVRFCNAISAITLEDKSVEEAMGVYNSIK